MKNIADIDKNFKIKTNISKEDIKFYNIKNNDFCLFGLMYDSSFRRLPENTAKNISKGVYALHTNTSGGRLRFITDSPYVAISAKMPDNVVFQHMPQTGISGFDMYADRVFVSTFIPPADMNGGFEGIWDFNDRRKREIVINFPLYNNVDDVFIGLQQDAIFEDAPRYSVKDPVIFYGSSITQGGCVSRPGNSYSALISNMLNCDFINLGFSGSAKGETAMAEYIAGLDCSVFVMDYDYNAPDADFLEKTHENFFRIFRNIHKTKPVIIISAPNLRFRKEILEKRRNVVRITYENAVKSGDKNVYFIDGETLWDGLKWDSCTIDGCHPNDLGHFRMAEKIAPIIKKVLS